MGCFAKQTGFPASSQAGVISASVPLMVAVGAWFLLAEPIDRNVFVNLVSVIAVILGWVVMGESLNAVRCIGAACVLFGVAISQK